MEEIRDVAMARYENLSENQKAEVRDWFMRMDTNGDGRVSLQEYLNHPKKDGYDQEMFELLDKDGNGYLNLKEFKTFEFIYKVRGFLVCEGCSCYLWGTYYACLTCYDAGNDGFGYNLCCSCYRKKNFQHDHTDFRDNHRICQLRRPQPKPSRQSNTFVPVNNAKSQIKIKEGKRAMEEMRDAAMAYYENLTEQQKQLAKKLFNAADTNGDGTVNVQEYLGFLKEQNFSRFVPPNLFKLLDKNGDGTMDFEEFVTLYYIMKVRGGIITCDGCDGNLSGLYFLCVECYQAGGRTYDLCCKCYHKKNFKHKHSTFLDSCVLLNLMRSKNNNPTQGNTSREVQVQRSNTQMREVKQALDVFEKALRFSNAASEAVNIVSNCSPM